MHEFRTRRRVEFADTDMAGICHFARYAIFMETAEHELLEALGQSVHMEMDGDQIRQVKFSGTGCAISTASASMMTEALTGKTRGEAEALSQGFRDLLTGQSPNADDSDPAGLGKLRVLAGVQQFPVRVKCATLAWHTLEAALHGQPNTPISTE